MARRVRHFKKFTGKKSTGRYYNVETGKREVEAIEQTTISRKKMKSNPNKERIVVSFKTVSPTGEDKTDIPDDIRAAAPTGVIKSIPVEMDSATTGQAITVGFKNNSHNRRQAHYFIEKHALAWSQAQYFGDDCFIVVDKNGVVLFQSDSEELARNWQSANGGILRENRKHTAPEEGNKRTELCNGNESAEYIYVTLNTGRDREKFRHIWEQLNLIASYPKTWIDSIVLRDNPHSANTSTAHHFPYRKPKGSSKPPKHRPASAQSDLKGYFA